MSDMRPQLIRLGWTYEKAIAFLRKKREGRGSSASCVDFEDTRRAQRFVVDTALYGQPTAAGETSKGEQT
jgi:hypothetical protein